LPELQKAGSLSLSFVPSVGDPIVLTLRDATPSVPNTFTFVPSANFSLTEEIVSATASSLPLGTYTVTLRYQDFNNNSAASVSNTNVRIIESSMSSSGGGGGGSGSRASKASEGSADGGGTSYAEEVSEVINENLVTKDLDKFANKCEVLTMMERAFEWKVPVAKSSKYTDVPEWCVSVAAYGTDRGIVEGRTPTKLGLETPVTRNEVAVMIHRELVKMSYEFEGTVIIAFNDANTPWALFAIQQLAGEGIVKGFTPDTFGGNQSILKQDLGIMLLRIKKSPSYQKVEDDSISRI
jgi:hypothetical protein